MKVLMLTWEYPPFIVGGLGMACYGLFKALSDLGVVIYMILPTKEKVFFEIDSPLSADYPVAKTWDKKQITPLPLKFYHFHYLEPKGVYFTLKEIFLEEKEEGFLKKEPQFLPTPEEVLKRIEFIISQENSLLNQVRLYTSNVLEISKNLEFDLVHAHDWLTYSAGLFVKNIKKVPLVSHIHATEFDRALGYGHPLIHEIEYLGLNYSEIVIAVSHYTAGIIKEHYFVPEKKITVVHNAFTAFTEKPFKVKKFKEPVVLFLGRLTPQKGPKIFLEIAKKVLEKEQKVRFLIAGTGEMERELMLEAASLGIGTHILFTGFLTRKEVEAALSMSDIVVMPSVSEPFGIVALEAMYFGCALILSKQSGVSEVIENAYKVDFWDIDKMVEIIIDLLQNPDKIQKLQENSKDEVKKFSWKERAQRVLHIYERLLN